MLHRSVETRARARTAAGIAVTLALSACGSTVQWSGTTEAERGGSLTEDGLSIGEPGTDLSARQRRAENFNATSTPGGASAVPRRSGEMVRPGLTPEAGQKTPLPGASGRGYTAKEIYIGYGTAKGAEDAQKRIGVTGFGDQEAQAKAVAKDISDRGGLAGRKIVLVFHDKGFGADAEQAMCERWTNDRPVFAVINLIAAEGLHECLAQRRTPYADLTPHPKYQHTLSRFAPYLYTPVQPAFERFIPVWTRRAKSLGYFRTWDTTLGRPGDMPVKIGILSYKNVQGANFIRIVRREVARLGYVVAGTIEGDYATSAGDAPQWAARFRDADVTHIIGQHQTTWYFQTAAAQQRYRPRYAISTYNNPQLLQKTASADQMAGALGIGWMPTYDVDNAHDPGDVSPAQTRCRNIMKNAGQNTSTRSEFRVMLMTCDGFNFLAAAISKGSMSPDGLRSGASAAGVMASGATFRMSFANGRFDGTAAVRDIGWQDTCNCFAYFSRANYGM